MRGGDFTLKRIDTDKLLAVGVALSKEKDRDLLLETILTAAMDFTDCDGGTLYTTADDALVFHTMITKSLGIRKNRKDGSIDLPPVPLLRENVCARAVLDGKPINLPDVYRSELYDFSGPRNYDALTGYRTVSMLVVPMENDRNDIIGVLQLINAKNAEGETVPFDADREPVILSLASQAAICLTNINYAAEITRLLDSFVRVMSVAIDERTPYNANHTRNMSRYAERFIDRLGAAGNDWFFDPALRRQFLMSVWLHDVGKLVTPLEIMDKESRLGGLRAGIEHRFETRALQNRIDRLEGLIDEASYEERAKRLAETLDLIRRSDRAGFLPDETIERIRALAAPVYGNADGTRAPLLEAEEAHALSVQKGTLTAEERAIMEGHVLHTERMLGQMTFPKDYENVPVWAAAHHEYADGSGYPRGFAGDKLPREVRLLTILDIFDALTARDRPYKPATTTEKALAILGETAAEGKLDRDILSLFEAHRPWEPAPGETTEDAG
jgi:HD-GYP domain-containing protein (c-di-GMP phosphodiesterase class II)